MEGLARELLPLASPIMDHVHQRYLQHFLDQDIVGHMELEVETGGDLDLGRVRVAIAFADLAGYTRLTEEAGEEEAVDIIERFVEAVQDTLPDDARVIKTIGDEVMIVGSDASAVLDWAVGFQQLQTRAPAAAHRHPPGADALPRRRLLRPRGQPRRAGRRARGGRRGAGHAPARGGRRPAPRVRAHRRGQAQGLQRVHGAVPGEAGVSLEARVREEGLLQPGAPVLVLLSGGPDSVCLLDLAVRVERRGDGAARRLRPARLGRRGRRALRRAVRAAGRAAARPPPAAPRGQPPGLGARRPLRRGAAARRAATSPPATPPPTRSRPCSTGSPRRPAGARCSACAPREGRVIRPLLGAWRADTEAWCAEHGLPWREDPTNASDAYARNRARHGLVPALRELHPAAEANVLRTLELLRDEAAVLDAAVDAVLAEAGEPPPLAVLRALPPALARLRAGCDVAGGARGRVTARTRSWRSANTARSTSAEGCARTIERGRAEFVADPAAGPRLDCAARAPRRIHRRDPRAGRRAPAPGAPAGRGDHARLRGQGPAADRRAEGRRLLPLRPHAPHRGALRGRLHGRRVLRLERPNPPAWCGSSRTSTPPSRDATC